MANCQLYALTISVTSETQQFGGSAQVNDVSAYYERPR